ncbi:SDR family NAD(P)-dependent oxidoreductase [Kordiimonas sp. SCSIO 12610]|uniref:SDR family NAD(P)-dependent oxidoreductase n=1 Tax=Kordiimonas sp. SCSIO 12610 TaxID=2829597 RepID=UPI00210D9890|nr:SDR family NAD(P)-dependent oxidoreductase [Kordiimonas sp. SCSIO 12610]UTW56072.1 SDR family NAD(P)-dependent oxidoreductase [Kordiimonas sp. SCSIO 12610]
MTYFAGKVAFVTGAASGIGLSIATALAQAGAKVMLCDIEKDALDKALGTLKATNADVDGVIADVSLKDEIQAAADATVERFGMVNILVNNAGVGGGGGYSEWTDASWDWTIGVNLMSVIWGVEIFGPLIEAAIQAGDDGGHIVNTASMAGLVSGGSPSYNVTKFGVVSLSEGLRAPMGERGIGVSVLCPGFVKTRIIESARNLQPRHGSKLEEVSPDSEAGRFAMLAMASVPNGISPDYVAELTLEGIEGDWPYILTDNTFEPAVDARFQAIKESFDRIRDRS